MKNSLLFITIFVSSLYSEVIELKKGWNLVGFSESYKAETLIEEKEIVNAIYYKNGEWLSSGEILPTHGVWIYSNCDCEKWFSESEKSSSRIDKLEISKGWNLLSLPVKTVISPKLFENQKTIWKYKSGNWSLYRNGNSELNGYPEIDYIGYGDGFWVYSEVDETINISDRESEMHSFSDRDEMIEYIDSMVLYNSRPIYPYYRGGIDMVDEGVMFESTAPTSSTSGDTSTSTSGSSSSTNKAEISDTTSTNTQEIDVDEADIVKHDGDKIFYLPSSSENSIFITTFDEVLKGNQKPVKTIETEKRPSEMYLIKNKLIAIYPQNSNFWGCWGDFSHSTWTNESYIEIYDVSDIDSIKKVDSYKFSGNFVDSRVTGGKLYLVSRFMPTVEISYEKEYCKKDDYCYYEDEKGSFKYDYNSPIYGEKKLLPKLNGEEFIEPEKLFAPLKVNQNSFITSVHSFDIDNFSVKKHISFIGNSSTLYASNSSIYLTSKEYPIYFGWNSYNERETLYKISLSDMSFRGKGFVDGRILNQFSLSESKSTLRIATTIGWSWGTEDTDNIVSALQESNGTLKTVGQIKGLGEEGETIKGVRFLGDRGYIVTFRTTDPLYVVDFKDPEKPILGKNPLKIDGYSTYFHPIDSEKILSVGVDADSEGSESGYQIQLFNIADLDNPTLLDKIRFPEKANVENRWNYYSESVYNHKAFVYRSSDQLFGVSLREGDEETVNRDEYIAENYVLLTEDILKKCEAKIELKEDLNYQDEIYGYKHQVDRCYITNVAHKDYLYIPETEWKNRYSLLLYSVDGSEIKSVDEVLHSGNENNYYSYNSNRGVIFTADQKDYVLYFVGGEFTLQEIK